MPYFMETAQARRKQKLYPYKVCYYWYCISPLVGLILLGRACDKRSRKVSKIIPRLIDDESAALIY